MFNEKPAIWVFDDQSQATTCWAHWTLKISEYQYSPLRDTN